jgi:hypothetical protein
VIRIRATSISRGPIRIRSATAVASPARTRLGHLVDREPLRQHERFGTAIGARRKQLECAAAGQHGLARATGALKLYRAVGVGTSLSVPSRARRSFRRQLLVKAAIAASRVGSQPCVTVRSR